MNGEDKDLMKSYDVGFTMEDPEKIQAEAQAEWEEGQQNKADDLGRWVSGRDASTSQEFWDALDATDPISFAVAGGAGSAVAASPASWREAERAHEVAGESLAADVRSKEASRRGAQGAWNRRNKALGWVGVESPTDYGVPNVQASDKFFSDLAASTGVTPQEARFKYFQENMVRGALKQRPPGFGTPKRLGNLYWAAKKAINEGAGFGSVMPVPDTLDLYVRTFINDKTKERAYWGAEKARRLALVADSQTNFAAHTANKAMKVGKMVGGKALKLAGMAGGAAGAAFMPTFMAMKELAKAGKLDATLAHMSYDLKGGPLGEGDLTDSTYDALVEDIDMSDKLYDAGVLSTDLHRSILQTAIREHLIEQTEIGQEGSPERYLGPSRVE